MSKKRKKSFPSRYILVTFVLVSGIVAWFLFAQAKSKGQIRNVLLISIDTCRADYLSCYGYKRKTTPNIDALAAEAIVFSNVISPVPITLPSHCSMLTGTIPPYHSIHNNAEFKLSESNVTLAELLKANGYATGAVISAFVLNSQFSIGQGFDTYNDKFEQTHFAGNIAERKGGQTSRIAIDWLEKHKNEKFFLFLHYYDPHDDYVPPEPFASEFADNLYAGEIAYADHCIGQVLEKLKELKLDKSTLIIITSDHGEMLGEHGEDTHMYFIYQGAVKVPLIFKVPGRQKHKVINKTVGLIDIVPTVCGLLKIPSPPQIQGEDLSAFFGKSNPKLRQRYLYSESLYATRYGVNSLLGVVTDGWKYIQTTRPELYDLAKDPAERTNLIDQQPQRARILQDKLKQILEQTVRKVDPQDMIELDAQAIRNLQSLGYVAGTKVSDDFEFDQTKEDPKDLIEFHNVYRRATGLFHKKQYDQVKEICKKLLADRPNFHELHDLMADIALMQNQYAQALPYLYQGLKLKPGRYKVHHNLAVALGKLGQSEESVEQFKKMIELAPNDPQTRNKIALELLRQKQVSLAITQFESSLNLDPYQPDTLNTMARIFATTSEKNLRDPKKAIELARRACELTNFKQPVILYTLSIACASAGQFPQAIENAQKALSLANMAKQNTLAMKIQKHLQSLEAVKPNFESGRSSK